MENELHLAITLIKAGDKVSAGKILADLVKHEPENEWAWYWLAACVKPIDQKKNCLRRTLRINPSNPEARQALARLEAYDGEVSRFAWLNQNRNWFWAGLGLGLIGLISLVWVISSHFMRVSAAEALANADLVTSLPGTVAPVLPGKKVPTSFPTPTRTMKYTPIPGYDPAGGHGGGEYNLPPAPDGFTWQMMPDLLMNTLVPEGWYFTQTVDDDCDIFFVSKEPLNAEGEFSTGMSVKIYREMDDVDQAAQDMIFDVTNRTTTTQVVDSLKLDSKSKTVTMYSVLISEEFSDLPSTDPGYHKKRVFDAIADTFRNTLYIIEFESPQGDWDVEWNERGGPITLSVINLLFAWR